MTTPSEVRIPIGGLTLVDLVKEIADSLGYTATFSDGELVLTHGRPPNRLIPNSPLGITLHEGTAPVTAEQPPGELVAELRKLDAEATAVPWEAEDWRSDAGAAVRAIVSKPRYENPTEVFGESGFLGPNDRAFVVALRNALPRLLDALSPREPGRLLIQPDRRNALPGSLGALETRWTPLTPLCIVDQILLPDGEQHTITGVTEHGTCGVGEKVLLENGRVAIITGDVVRHNETALERVLEGRYEPTPYIATTSGGEPWTPARPYRIGDKLRIEGKDRTIAGDGPAPSARDRDSATTFLSLSWQEVSNEKGGITVTVDQLRAASAVLAALERRSVLRHTDGRLSCSECGAKWWREGEPRACLPGCAVGAAIAQAREAGIEPTP